MARQIYCDTPACGKPAAFLLTVTSTGQTSAFCADHFAASVEAAIREFDVDGDASPLTRSMDPAITPDRVPYVAAVAMEVSDAIWASGSVPTPDEIIAHNTRGWSVTVPVIGPDAESSDDNLEIDGIVLSSEELEAAIGIVMDALADRVPLPEPQPAVVVEG